MTFGTCKQSFLEVSQGEDTENFTGKNGFAAEKSLLKITFAKNYIIMHFSCIIM